MFKGRRKRKEEKKIESKEDREERREEEVDGARDRDITQMLLILK